MTIYDIEVLMVNDELVSLGSGYLNFYDNDVPKSWNVELYDTNNDSLFHRVMDNKESAVVKIGTKDGSSFIGKVLITKLEIGPLGTTVLFTGTGKLTQLEK